MKRIAFFVGALVVLVSCIFLAGCTQPVGQVAPTVPVPVTVTVPGVVGLTETAASSVLTSAGLTIGMVTSSFDAAIPVGIVTTQSPIAGTAVPPGSSVAVVTSKGPDSVTVADVKGDSESKARSALTADGLAVTVVTKDDKSKKGTVLKQSPSAGSTLLRGATVKLTVSTGMVTVPSWKDFEGSYKGDDWNKILASAKSAVEAGFHHVGLVAVVEFVNGAAGDKEYQSPKAHTRAKTGTKVHIHIPVVD